MFNHSIAHTNDIFQTVRDIPFPEVQQAFHGAEPRRNKIPCPFHSEKTPSFTIYPKGFKCYGCGEAGDSVAFVSKLLNLRPLDAARAIAERFGIPVRNGPLSKEEKKRIAEAQAERERKRMIEAAFALWCKEATENIRTIAEAIRFVLAEEGLNIDEKLLPLVHQVPWLEYAADTLSIGTDVEKIEIYRTRERWWTAA